MEPYATMVRRGSSPLLPTNDAHVTDRAWPLQPHFEDAQTHLAAEGFSDWAPARSVEFFCSLRPGELHHQVIVDESARDDQYNGCG